MSSFTELLFEVVSASGLKREGFPWRMRIRAAVKVNGDPVREQTTAFDPDGGSNPMSRHQFRLFIPDTPKDPLFRHHYIDVELSRRNLAGEVRSIGSVRIHIGDLRKNMIAAADSPAMSLSFPVTRPSGRVKGLLNVSYCFGQSFTAPAPPVVAPLVVIQNYGAAAAAWPPHGFPPPAAAGYGPATVVIQNISAPAGGNNHNIACLVETLDMNLVASDTTQSLLLKILNWRCNKVDR